MSVVRGSGVKVGLAGLVAWLLWPNVFWGAMATPGNSGGHVPPDKNPTTHNAVTALQLEPLSQTYFLHW